MRWRSCLLLALVAVLHLITGPGARAQQPTPVPTPDPIAVVQQFWDAVNRQDAAAATALFAPTASFRGEPPCSPAPCTGPAAIADQLNQRWIPNTPFTVSLERTTSTTVTFRGQGSTNQRDATYAVVRFEVAAGRIMALTLVNQFDCSGSSPPGVCMTTPTPPPPPPTPRPAPSAGQPVPAPLTVVQQYFDAINKGEPETAAALFSAGGEYFSNLNPALPCSPSPCTSSEEIASIINRAWVFYNPHTTDLEQVAPTTVIARGQGSADRQKHDYFEVRFEVSHGQITRYEGIDFQQCAQATSASICPPPPVTTAPPAVAAAQQNAQPPAPTVPAQPPGPTPVRDRRLPAAPLLVVLVVLGVTAVGLLAGAAGLLVRRLIHRPPPA